MIADDVVHEALVAAGSAMVLTPEDAQAFIGKLWQKYTTPEVVNKFETTWHRV
jgi:hypothetical protein